jgi:hypothetical protein
MPPKQIFVTAALDWRNSHDLLRNAQKTVANQAFVTVNRGQWAMLSML